MSTLSQQPSTVFLSPSVTLTTPVADPSPEESTAWSRCSKATQCYGWLSKDKTLQGHAIMP